MLVLINIFIYVSKERTEDVFGMFVLLTAGNYSFSMLVRFQMFWRHSNEMIKVSWQEMFNVFEKGYLFMLIDALFFSDSDMENASSIMDESSSSFLLNEDSISSMDIDINALEKVWFKLKF